MGAKTAIEWTHHTFNPWWGCTEISPGCDNCYARAWALRVGMKLWGTDAPRRVFDHKHWAEPLRWNRLAGERGAREHVFCASMADVFESLKDFEDERDKLWTLIHKTPHLDWQLLTKRVGNVARMVPPSWLNGHWPAHAWLGISVVNQEEADRDIPKLLALPARVRFLSIEPLLGPIDLPFGAGHSWCPICKAVVRDNLLTFHEDTHDVKIEQTFDPARHCASVYDLIHWVISGGESGPKARPSHPDWHRALRDQCAAAGVPFLFKQWGEWGPDWDGAMTCTSCGRTKFDAAHRRDECSQCGGDQWHEADKPLESLARVGKKAAGRLLDGRTHDEFPQ